MYEDEVCMVTEVKSKSELQAIAGKLKNTSNQLTLEVFDIIGNLSSKEDFDGVHISQAAMAIQNNLKNLSGEMDALASSINNYAADIKSLDIYDIKIDGSEQVNSTQTSIGASGSNETKIGQNGSTHSSESNKSSSMDKAQEMTVAQQNNLSGEGEVKITQGDPNYELKDGVHQYAEPIFQMTRGNLAYEISDNDFDLLCAIVSAESDKSYDGSLAVASTILNRCEHLDYVTSYGANPVAQATAYNQFLGYRNQEYKQYINGQYSQEVMQAVKDALAGVRNHKICNFSKGNMISL